MEIPVKKIMDGNKIEDAISKGAMKNPDCLNEFIDIKNQIRIYAVHSTILTHLVW